VIRLRTLFVLVLAALWLPATSHCALESAALIASHCCESGSHDEPAHDAGGDLCCAWESSFVSQPAGTALVKAPFLACECLLCCSKFLLPSFVPAESVPTAPRPADWLAIWQFEYRAAPPARAPSLT
jgi:hypothetical protein